MKRTAIARLLGVTIRGAYVEGFENLDADALTEIFRQLCRLNSMAFNGYRELTWEQNERNRVVYGVKDDVLEWLADALYEAGADVSYWEGVVYVRNSKGIQMSLHTYRDGWDLCECPYRKETHWDGVFDAWRYKSKRRYAEAKVNREEAEAVVKEAQEEAQRTGADETELVRSKLRERNLIFVYCDGALQRGVKR